MNGRVFDHASMEILADSLEADRYAYFAPTGGEGGEIRLTNGITVSIQYSEFHYSSKRGNPNAAPTLVEVAAWEKDSTDFIKLGEFDDVLGWQSWEDVCALVGVLAER